MQECSVQNVLIHKKSFLYKKQISSLDYCCKRNLLHMKEPTNLIKISQIETCSLRLF
jgi:hypothetical protein